MDLIDITNQTNENNKISQRRHLSIVT